MNIPIANTFRLLAYAWDVVEEADVRLVGTESLRAPVDALGHALAGAAGDLIRRGIRREYVEQDQVVAGIRGKLLIGATIKRNLLSSARTECRVTELTEDTPANRIIRSTVHAVLAVRNLDSGVRNHLDEIDGRLAMIPLIRPRPADFFRVQIHRNNRLYRLVLSICRLIHENLVPDERGGSFTFRDFRRDRRFMWRLFERFVFRFYEREQQTYRVDAPKIRWADLESFESDPRWLPRMQTDIVLESPERVLVIDTKFYDHPLTTNRFGTTRIRSSHLYQLLTYITQLRRSPIRRRRSLDGVLLYAAVDKPFDFRYAIDGAGIRVAALDLARSWDEIRARLLGLVDPWRTVTPAPAANQPAGARNRW